MESGNVGVLAVGGDQFHLIGRGEQPLRHVRLLALQLQHHLEQVGDGADAAGNFAAGIALRPFGFRHRKAARHRRQHLGSGGALGELAGEAAGAGELVRGLRRVVGDLQQRLVADHPGTGNVAGLGVPLPPCRQLAQHRQHPAVAAAAAHAAEGQRRGDLVVRRIGELRHFLGQPVATAGRPQPRRQLAVDGQQVGDIGDGVFRLARRQRPQRPVGEARTLVDARLGQLADQRLVGDLVAEAAHHRRHLRIEHRLRQHAAHQPVEDLQILAGGMKHLQNLRCLHHPEQRREIHAGGQRINRHRLIATRNLHETELRPVGALAHEFGIDRDRVSGQEPLAKGLKFRELCDQGHRRQAILPAGRGKGRTRELVPDSATSG